MKTGVLLALLLVIAVAAVYFVFSKPAYVMSEAEAKKFFLEDLAQKYPDAEVRDVMEILNITQSDGTQYYQLKARVTKGLATPCPERTHVYYDYPPKNFVAQQPEPITKGCQVCLNEPKCILAFPEEAIIASHTYNGTETIQNFIKYNSGATATATPLESFEGYANGVWIVQWKPAAELPTSYTVVLSKTDNSVLNITKGELTIS
jgi:hypothetical protein